MEKNNFGKERCTKRNKKENEIWSNACQVELSRKGKEKQENF